MQAHVKHNFLLKIEIKLRTQKKPIENLKFFQWTQKKNTHNPLPKIKRKKLISPFPPFKRKKSLACGGI
jgi:hypothetical protein